MEHLWQQCCWSHLTSNDAVTNWQDLEPANSLSLLEIHIHLQANLRQVLDNATSQFGFIYSLVPLFVLLFLNGVIIEALYINSYELTLYVVSVCDLIALHIPEIIQPVLLNVLIQVLGTHVECGVDNSEKHCKPNENCSD